MNDSMSPADFAAVSGGGFGGFGGEGIWLFAILALMGGGFGNFGGNRERNATVGDVQRATDFAALERQNNETVAAVRQAAYDNAGAIKDGNYNILGELRDLQMATASSFGKQQECCCETLRAIDVVNYNGAINTANILPGPRIANTIDNTRYPFWVIGFFLSPATSHGIIPTARTSARRASA